MSYDYSRSNATSPGTATPAFHQYRLDMVVEGALITKQRRRSAMSVVSDQDEQDHSTGSRPNLESLVATVET